MATIISHAVAAAGIAALFPAGSLKRRAWIAGALFSMVPDADVMSFRFGIAYADVLGHRGFTHSLVFAAVLGGVGAFALFPHARAGVNRGLVLLYLFLATASHGVLDALTNGGHGVAFFAPFGSSRYFFPFTPIEVSPIGVSRFFSSRGAEVLLNEMLWIWLPAAVAIVSAWTFRRVRRSDDAGLRS
jgi:inner membrane protein